MDVGSTAMCQICGDSFCIFSVSDMKSILCFEDHGDHIYIDTQARMRAHFFSYSKRLNTSEGW